MPSPSMLMAIAALGGVLVGLLTLVLGVVTLLWNKLDRRFGDLKTDVNQRLDNLKTDVNQRFDDLKTDVNQRFDDLKTDVNQRFDNLKTDVNQRFDAADRQRREDRAYMDKRFGELAALVQEALKART